MRLALTSGIALALAACAPAPPADAGPADASAYDTSSDGATLPDAPAADAPAADASPRDASGDGSAVPDARETDAAPGDGGACGAVTLAMVQERVFAGCTSGLFLCHGPSRVGGSMRAGNLDLTAGRSYADLVNVPAAIAAGDVRVRPNDVEHSFLWRKITNDLPSDRSQGSPMPQGEGIGWRRLTAEQLDTVRCWIAQGAPER